MVKELSLVIILGLIIGFLVTGGVISLTRNKNSSTNNITPTPSVAAITTSPSETTTNDTPTPVQTLTITSPVNETVVDTDKQTLTGTTNPNATVVIATSNDSITATADKQGNFSVPITLDVGINGIQVVSFDQSGNHQEVDLTVTYSTAKI